ncbi:hypothetical protein ACHHYP_20581 [Achlya hypogyna]|uniref:SWIM-type domain-containing protein n=1 Tax=Achlya hypogyna TaxID=1202772 RepID=A0A1V9ZHB5_ACHHY|nr:hypothetical protein ACHHYP_20581 [Achlya hypogyna]
MRTIHRIITPYAKQLLDAQQALAPRYKIFESTATVVYVKDPEASAAAKRRVDLGTHSWTCGFMLQMGVPCRHYIRVLMARNLMASIHDACSDCYKVDDINRTWESNKGIELPIADQLDRDTSIKAPPRQSWSSQSASNSKPR